MLASFLVSALANRNRTHKLTYINKYCKIGPVTGVITRQFSLIWRSKCPPTKLYVSC